MPSTPEGTGSGSQEGTPDPGATDPAVPSASEGTGSGNPDEGTVPSDPSGTPGSSVSDSDAGGAGQPSASDGDATRPSVSDGDAAQSSVSDGDAVLPSVSDSDAALPGREPGQFHEEAVPEDYGTLVSYDAYSRTYHVDGDSYITVIGNDGSTYIDEDGLLQSVDNRLVQEESALFSLMGAGSTAYRNSAGDYTVLFPGDMGTGGTDAGEAQTGTAGYGTPETGAGITILSGGHAMILYPAEGTFRDGVVRDNAIRYSNVFPDIDYQYTVLGDSVKEDIILLSHTEKSSFSYLVDSCGLEATLLYNTLFLHESGADPETGAVFVLEAPEMEDAAGEISFGIRMSLEERADGLYLVTVTPDPAWLEDPVRAYPVRIDPTAVQVTGSAIRIACAEEGSPDTAIGDNQYPYVGYDDGVTSGNYAGFGSRHLNCRSYFAIDYDFSKLAAEAEIVSATFQVCQKTRWSKGTSEFGLYGVEEPWQVRGLTWNNQLAYGHYFLDSQNATTTRGQALSYDVTEEVSAWINGTAENHGFVMKAQVEAPNKEAANAGVKMQCEVFYNNSSARYAPKLVLSWTGELTDLDAMSLDDTTIEIYPVVERKGDRSTSTLGVVAHGLARAGSTVHYSLVDGATGETVAATSLQYPDSGLYAGAFPTAMEYKRRLSNWQSEVFSNLEPGRPYYMEAYAEGPLEVPGTGDGTGSTGDGGTGSGTTGSIGPIVKGATVTSDTFLIHREGALDLVPRIARHYGVEADTIMADMRMQDALSKEGNLLFIRSPRNTAPYTAGELPLFYRAVIDGLLLGRAQDCQYGFEPINLNTGNFYMEQTDAANADLGGDFTISRAYNSLGDRKSVV